MRARRVGPETKLNGSRTHLNVLVGIDERLHLLKEKYNLTDQEASSLLPSGGLDIETADIMSENVIGTARILLAIIPDLIVNGRGFCKVCVGFMTCKFSSDREIVGIGVNLKTNHSLKILFFLLSEL